MTALPADRQMAVASARPEDRKSMREGLETASEIFAKRAHYDPSTGHQVRPHKKKKSQHSEVIDQEEQEEQEEEENQKEEDNNGVDFTVPETELRPQDFVIVEELKKAVKTEKKRSLYLAKVLQTNPLIMHLWIVNRYKKITPTYSKVSGKRTVEWFRQTEGTPDPPAGFTPWDIGTDKWRILASSPTFSAEMKTLLESSVGPFSFYKD